MKPTDVRDGMHVHFIGIGGSGLSAIARMLKESGYTVTGSDQTLSTFAADLQAAGVTVHIGHDGRNVEGADWVVRSSAVPDDNPEVRAAQSAGIPVYRRSDFLGRFMENKTGVAVAGTHGKTTTTAMIAYGLLEMGLDPSFIVGGVLSNLGVNAKAGTGDLFVVEADEYDRMFLGLKPRIEVITSIEFDHPDCFPTYDDMLAAFESFISLLPHDGTLVACLDDAGASSLMLRARRLGRQVMAYSREQELTITAPRWMQARKIKLNSSGGYDFEAATNVGATASVAVSLQIPGAHNVGNALAALSVIALLGLSIGEAAKALHEFTGTSRRFEVRGEQKGVTIIDDYAHHPTEIKATLAAARGRYPGRRLWAVWQPHTYSRTKALFKGFATAFGDADETIVTEVYAAREPKEDFSAQVVVQAMPRESTRFIPSLEETTRYLLQHLRKDDVLLVLSAGDAERVSADVLSGLRNEVNHD
jgi:UDP-N-acetylmuramate--alanine ligase